MCDIKEKTRFKTKTVYKVVEKCGGNYYSYYTGKPVTVGKVTPLTEKELEFFMTEVGFDVRYAYNPTAFKKAYIIGGTRIFNKKMMGKISAFASLSVAKRLKESIPDPCEILKIKLGGEILKGTSDKMGYIPPHYVTYAGSEVLSIKEIES